jgi:hypothetical protein
MPATIVVAMRKAGIFGVQQRGKAALPEGSAQYGREIELQLARGLSLFTTEGFISAEAAEAYTRARELAERWGDRRQLFMAIYGLWQSANARCPLQTGLIGAKPAFSTAAGPRKSRLCGRQMPRKCRSRAPIWPERARSPCPQAGCCERQFGGQQEQSSGARHQRPLCALPLRRSMPAPDWVNRR